MMALGYVIVAIVTIGGLLLACGIVFLLWLGISGSRPDLMERTPPPEGSPGVRRRG
jgi:hypothetical protein